MEIDSEGNPVGRFLDGSDNGSSVSDRNGTVDSSGTSVCSCGLADCGPDHQCGEGHRAQEEPRLVELPWFVPSDMQAMIALLQARDNWAQEEPDFRILVLPFAMQAFQAWNDFLEAHPDAKPISMFDLFLNGYVAGANEASSGYIEEMLTWDGEDYTEEVSDGSQD